MTIYVRDIVKNAKNAIKTTSGSRQDHPMMKICVSKMGAEMGAAFQYHGSYLLSYL